MMSGERDRNFLTRRRRAFTLIEMLTVIGIIMLVMALALPNFFSMMRARRWTEAVGVIQGTVMRARALATNERKDMAVEFDLQGDEGTYMWVESEQQVLERIPDLDVLQHQLGGGGAIYWIVSGPWYDAGGTYSYSSGWYSNFEVNGTPKDYRYGDNARQTEVVSIGNTMTLDASPGFSENFFNWDSETSVEKYGHDKTRDIRIGPNGALVQTLDPILCIRQRETKQYKRVQIIRCTGRLINPD